ncbi:MAG: hypothetical protein LBE91_01550 [Tannerella sp.]|nr:hypothetical protein [Tannerella sp.]
MKRKLSLLLIGCVAIFYALPATAFPQSSEGEELSGHWEVAEITVEKLTINLKKI